jgi:hypothetical protein
VITIEPTRQLRNLRNSPTSLQHNRQVELKTTLGGEDAQSWALSANPQRDLMATLKNPKGLAPTTYEWESSDSYAAFTHGVRTFSGRDLNI